jgi:hypothetical protein
MPFPIPTDVTATQNEWRFCGNCSQLFWAPQHLPDGTTKPAQGWGSCPAAAVENGGHVEIGWEFYLLANPAK